MKITNLKDQCYTYPQDAHAVTLLTSLSGQLLRKHHETWSNTIVPLSVSLNFIHVFEYKLHKYDPQNSVPPPIRSITTVHVATTVRVRWQEPRKTHRACGFPSAADINIYNFWPMKKTVPSSISMWRHSRIYGVVQTHGVELRDLIPNEGPLFASLTPMSCTKKKLAPFSLKPFWMNTDFYETRYKKHVYV